MNLKFFLILSFVAVAFCKVNHRSWKRTESSGNDLDIFQSPECHKEKGVCAPLENCHKNFLHPAEDLCDINAGYGCCLTTTFKSKEVIQMPGCEKLNSICTWNHLCDEKDRQENTLLCGGQENVSCCKVKEEAPIETSKRVAPASETRPPCVNDGGMCIINGECDDIIKPKGKNILCFQRNAKCCRPINHQLLRNIEDLNPVKRDEEYIPITQKRSNVEDMQMVHLRLPESLRELGSKCGTRGGECRLIEECGQGFTDNAASCGSTDLTCCVFTRKTKND